MKGKLIVVEGINGVGKTSSLKKAIEMIDLPNILYSKGFSRRNAWERFINAHPSSFAYYLDFAYKTADVIKPHLVSGWHVLQDRYIQSVDSFPPDAGMLHNRLFRRFFSPFFAEPDLYIQLTADHDEIIARLTGDDYKSDYRSFIINNPDHLKERESNYMKIFADMRCKKELLDTTGKSLEESAETLCNIIRREITC